MSPSPFTLPNPDAQAVGLVCFDFDGVFTDNAVWVSEDGKESVRCWRSDGLGLEKLRALGLPVWVLSTEANPVVTRRCEKLKVNCRQNLPDKRQALLLLADELNIPLERVMYVGNDINDLGCLQAVGVPVVVKDAHPDVLFAAKYQTALPGGFGAVREVCDWLANCRRPLQAVIEETLSGASKS